ncbi:iron-containing alcohol dehydrogenase [Halocella sp. SP3-1]|uniref:iron-containing alcohol dehydrogenase n=1 Tax=Halocella sp. SP3-1 TaxID=2382161 RepID=UPI000F757399|nr:iron-containing alcohol dehydrogenase [Halocella sp. SP3-1]AZO93198.1 iron-containing alcohol dehydrogenase [Halocella sp. SP3-1]
MDLKQKAKNLLRQFKGDDYALGVGILDEVGKYAKEYGDSALLISNYTYLKPVVDKVKESLKKYGVALAGNRIVRDAAPNAPREDVYRLEGYILNFKPDCIIVIGGGSAIDAAKAANVLASVGHYSADIEDYFGTGLVTKALQHNDKQLLPLMAIETSASSGAHLTKYSNVTDPVSGQKKLIVDEAVIPTKSVFDYSVTETMPLNLTIDGAFDGIAHTLEVFYGIDEENFELCKEIAETAIELIVKYTPKVIDNLEDTEAREALGLATDLGGYAIMVGGTNGGHLTSFSLVDVTSHGRACGIMNLYYTVFFAPAIEKKLRVIGNVFKKYGYIKEDLTKLSGKDLGIAVAEGMKNFAKDIDFPTKLSDLDGFNDKHITRALEAAKNPQLDMKLKNMPVPLNASLIEEYMGPILEAAKEGDFSIIKNLK